MRNVLKAATIESKFPLLAVEQDCIISKDADITVAFRVELPELFTVTTPGESNQGTAELFGGTQAGLVYQGELPAENG